MVITTEGKDERSTGFHRYTKNMARLVLRLFKVKHEWIEDPSIEVDSQTRCLRKVLMDYSRYEDDRDPRKDLILNVVMFAVLLFHNDQFYRERMGWFIWRMHEEIEKGAFGYEKLFMVHDGQPVSGQVGYDPDDWFGAPAGRGWDSTEKKDYYNLSEEELEQSKLLWEQKQRETYLQYVKEGLIRE